MTSSVTIVMYHYVRPASRLYPNLKALEATGFEDQLDLLREKFDPISVRDLSAAMFHGNPLPERPILFTFDDGYIDHHKYAVPAMLRRGFSGAFFPVACSALERNMLLVNKIQFVLATGCDVTELTTIIDKSVDEYGLGPLSSFRSLYFQPGRLDGSETNYVKKMLQTGLPKEVREKVVDELFRHYVSEDEHSFADELYMSLSQLRELEDSGMHVGGHGAVHNRLVAADDIELAEEIAATDRLLDMLRQPDGVKSLCYPYGSYDDRTIEALDGSGFHLAFTTDVGVAQVQKEERLRLRRLDTNYFR